MKKTVLLCTTACIATALCAQPNLKQQKVYGGIDGDILYQICITKDSGLVLAGVSASGISGNKTTSNKGSNDYWIIKQSKAGDKKWEKDIGGSNYDILTDIKPTADSGFILAGYSASSKSGNKSEDARGNGADYWIVKVDNLGRKQWDKTYGGNEDDRAHSVIQTSDGGYLVAGGSYSDAAYDKTGANINCGCGLWNTYDIWLVKLDASGNKLWDKTIGSSADEGDLIYHAYTPHQGNNRHHTVCKQAPDGGFVIATSSNSNIAGNKTENSYNGSPDYWVVKTDTSGNVVWDRTIGGTGEDYLSAMDIAVDGSILVGGYSWSDISGNKTQGKKSADYWIVKLTSTGTILWDKTIGGGSVDILQEIEHTSDGGFILAGNSSSAKSGDKTASSKGVDDYWIVKINSAGAIEWDKTIGGSGGDAAYEIIEYSPNVYYVGGYSNSPISGDKKVDSIGNGDYWLVKLIYSLGNQTLTTQSIASSKWSSNNAAGTLVYPNPATTVLHIQSSSKATFILSDLSGKKMLSKLLDGNGDLNVSNIPAGMYYLTNTTSGAVQKIMITK